MKSLQREENDRLLTIFWRKATDATRWGRRDLLRRWADIRIAVGASIRVSKKKVRNRQLERKRAPICWCCRHRTECQAHHILAVAHGGLSIRRNFVDLCKPCHVDVHRTYQQDDPRVAALPQEAGA